MADPRGLPDLPDDADVVDDEPSVETFASACAPRPERFRR